MRYIFPITLLILAGCSSSDSRIWMRQDGGRVEHSHIQTAHTVCHGEMAKADAASVAPVNRRFEAADAVMQGCMIQRGYVLREPAPGASIATLR
jgi:hypothetical protein